MDYKNLPILLLISCFISCKKNDTGKRGSGASEADYGMLCYVSTAGLVGYDLNTNKRVWTAANVFEGDVNALVYDDGLIYTSNIWGIAATDAATGTVKWRTYIGTTAYVMSLYIAGNQPVVKDSLVYLISIKGVSDHSVLSCLHKKTGAIKWQKDLNEGVISVAKQYSTPIIADGKVIALSNAEQHISQRNRVYCFDAVTGAQLWLTASVTDNLFRPFPVRIGSKVAYAIHSGIYGYDISNGTQTWLYGSASGSLNPRYPGYRSNNEVFMCLIAPPYNTVNNISHIDVIDGTTGQFKRRYTDTLQRIAVTDKNLYVARSPRRMVQSRNLSDFTLNWSWNCPSKAMMDTMSLPTLSTVGYGSYVSNLITDDTIVYFYENLFARNHDMPQIELNSMFMLDAKNGKLLKEVKFGPPVPDSVISRNYLIIRNGQAYRSNQGL